MAEAFEEQETLLLFDNMSFVSRGKALFERVTYRVRKGSFVIVSGPSGSGITSFLKLGAGLYLPTAGAIYLKGQDTVAHGKKKRPIMKIKSENGFFFQDNALFSTLTVYDNVALHMRYNTRASEAEIEERIAPWFKRYGLDLSYMKTIRPENLSSREKKYVNMIRATMHAPETLFVDSLFDGADTATFRKLRSELHSLYLNNDTTVIAGSDRVSTYSYIATHVAVLRSGAIYFQGTIDEFRERRNDDPYLFHYS